MTIITAALLSLDFSGFCLLFLRSATNSISMVTWSCSNSGIEVMKPGNNTIKPRPQALSLSLSIYQLLMHYPVAIIVCCVYL